MFYLIVTRRSKLKRNLYFYLHCDIWKVGNQKEDVSKNRENITVSQRKCLLFLCFCHDCKQAGFMDWTGINYKWILKIFIKLNILFSKCLLYINMIYIWVNQYDNKHQLNVLKKWHWKLITLSLRSFLFFFTFLGPHEISTGLPIQSTKCEVHIKNVASQCVWGMVFYF